MTDVGVGAGAERGRPGIRRRVYDALEPRRNVGRLSLTNHVLIILILLATTLGVLETEPSLTPSFGAIFAGMEMTLGVVFLLEYLARLWSAPERDAERSAWAQRLRFMVSPAGFADLVAVVATLAPASSSSAILLRLVRLLRILRVAKLGRMSEAVDHISAAVASRREELLISLGAGLLLMLASATALYLVEGAVQPDRFGSIPRALWWAVATLTTIGYGDVYPITPLGKVLAALTAITSIGLVAMPTGILAAAFSDAMQRRREAGQLAEDGGRGKD